MNEKKKHINHMHGNRNSRKKHAHITCYKCGRKGHIVFYCSFKKKHSSFKKIWVPKGSHVLTNNQEPIKIWYLSLQSNACVCRLSKILKEYA